MKIGKSAIGKLGNFLRAVIGFVKLSSLGLRSDFPISQFENFKILYVEFRKHIK
jgi:hypothetical protein